MITITVEVDDIDYGALVRKLLPIAGDKLSAYDTKLARMLSGALAIGGGAAANVINALPAKTKDALAAALINGGKEKIAEALRDAAKEHGVGVKIRDIGAECSETPEAYEIDVPGE